MNHPIITSLEEMPMIAAVKNDDELAKATLSPCHVVFLLYGDICNIATLVAKVKASGKYAVVHIDLIDGLENKPIAVNFIKTHTQADGIISTKPHLVKASCEAGLFTVQRVFMIDSIAFKNMKKHIEQGHANMVEVLPGVMPKVIQKIVKEVNVPIIAGGLIFDKEDVISVLGAGATAVSTTLTEVWAL